MHDWDDVGRALLGSWPSQVASWGREAIAAYVHELGSRGLSPDCVLKALRSIESKFPPSVGEVVASVRFDSAQPTFDEAFELIFGRGGVIRARDPQVRLRELPRTVQSYVWRQGLERLGRLPLNDPQWGEKHRRDLREAWDRHIDVLERREIALIAMGHRTESMKQLSATIPQALTA